VKCEAHRHIFQPCLSGCAVRGTKELGKFHFLEFTVNATCNGRCARRNLSRCRRPGLLSIHSADQRLGHALERSHHHHNNQLDQRQHNQHNHVNGTRSEPQVAGRTRSDTICNGLLVTTTILVTGAKFIFFSYGVCARVQVTTHLTVRRHSTTNETRPRSSATKYDHRHRAHNTNI
jgi:hypothetical protein